MILRVLLLALVVGLFWGCVDKLEIKNVKPDYLLGEWVSNLDAVDLVSANSILQLNSESYLYLDISMRLSFNLNPNTGDTLSIDTLSIDTLYRESGSWSIEFLDGNNNDIYDMDEEDAYLYTKVTAATVAGNVGQVHYMPFEYGVLGSYSVIDVYSDGDNKIQSFYKALGGR